MTVPVPPATVASRRPPVPVVVASVVVAVRMGFGAFGLVYFGVLAPPEVNPDAGSPAATAFAAVGLTTVITAWACLPGVWACRRAPWHLLTCVLAAWVYFSCYKILAEGETESIAFLVVDVLVAGLLCLPTSRRHVAAGDRSAGSAPSPAGTR